MSDPDETTQLMNLLESVDIQPHLLEGGLAQFSDKAKNAAAAKIASAFAPPPPGRVLGRLLYILTPENRTQIETALIANLRSPDASARRFSLYGLDQLAHSASVDFALQALRDDDESVALAATTILLAKAKDEPNIKSLLQGFYQTSKQQGAFETVVNLLETHGFRE
ncbi:MAG: HEAT repeat domain-containing protein [Caldilineaceae bacterium]|nr:HEAT repeat domain-containing protein [Caldilineaceae bacterium]